MTGLPIEVHPPLVLPPSLLEPLAALAGRLPPGSRAFHRRPVVDLAGVLSRGEDTLPDLVLTLPGTGILAVHLVPWQLTVDAGGIHHIDGPHGRMTVPNQFEAAERSVWNLARRITPAHGGEDPHRIGLAILAPRGSVECQAGPVAGWLLAGRGDLLPGADLAGRLLGFMGAEARAGRLGWDEGWPARLRDAYRPHLETGRYVQGSGQPLRVGLGDEQMQAYRSIIGRPRISVGGPAGCGKTLLAMERARLEAGAGRRTLLTCYNRALAESLAATLLPVHGGNLRVLNFHDTCRLFCAEAGIPFEVPAVLEMQPRFYRHEAPALLARSAGEAAWLGFDSLIVDEAQDFHPEWWEALFRCGQPGPGECRVAVFHDQTQNVFRPGGEIPAIPGDVEEVRIGRSWRNTRQVYGRAVEISGLGGTADPSAMPDGPPTEASTAGGGRALADAVMKKLRSLAEMGLRPSEIAVLGPSGKSEAYGLLRHQSAIPLASCLGEWAEGGRPLLMTWRKFRGLEARAVILFDLGNPACLGAQQPADLYTAATRAREHLATFHWPDRKVKGGA